MHATKTYTYNTLAKDLHLNINKQLLSVTYDFYIKIIVIIDMHHLQEITHKHTSNHSHIYDKIVT
jgi:hypothetical protein